MKKIISLLLSAMLIISFPVFAQETSISVLLDGEYITFDVAPATINDRTMVPVRAIFEALGATVDWLPESGTVLSNMGETEVRLTVNDATLYKNGSPVTLDVPAQIVNERTLVPVRAISEAYDCQVAWHPWNRTVVIISDLDKVTCMTVNNEPVSMAYFNFALSNAESQAMQMLQTNPEGIKETWNEFFGDGTLGDLIINAAIEQCVFTKSNAQKAKSLDITLTEEEKALIENNVILVQEFLPSVVSTQAAAREFYTDDKYAEKYYNTLMEENILTDEEAKKNLDENFVTAKHVLISTRDAATGAPLSAEEKVEKKKLAEDILYRIRRGADFDKMVKEYGEDPGMTANPDGYFFTKGEMVAEFEEATFSLKPSQVSGIVESAYGYHIIKRLPNKAYTVEELENAKNVDAYNQALKNLNDNSAAASITRNSAMMENVVPVGLD